MNELVHSLTQRLTPETMRATLINNKISMLLTRIRMEKDLDTYQFADYLNIDHNTMLEWLKDGYDFSVTEVCYILEKTHTRLKIIL